MDSYYNINNILYESSYDLSLMDEVIKYELDTTKHLIDENNSYNFYLEICNFLNKILFKNISYLFYFLYTLDIIILNKLRINLQNYYQKVINGVSKNNNKNNFINNLCKIIFKKLTIIEFTSFFTENDFLKSYLKFKKLNF